jgi:hypothetical protein
VNSGTRVRGLKGFVVGPIFGVLDGTLVGRLLALLVGNLVFRAIVGRLVRLNAAVCYEVPSEQRVTCYQQHDRIPSLQWPV